MSRLVSLRSALVGVVLAGGFQMSHPITIGNDDAGDDTSEGDAADELAPCSVPSPPKPVTAHTAV